MYHRLLSAGWDYRCEPPHPASHCASNVSLYPLPVNGRSGRLIRCEQVGCVFRGSGCSLPPRRHGMPVPHLPHPPSRRDPHLATFRVIGTGSTETVSGFVCRCCCFGMVVASFLEIQLARLHVTAELPEGSWGRGARLAVEREEAASWCLVEAERA